MTFALTSKGAFSRQTVEKVETAHGHAFIRVMSGRERDDWMRVYRAEQDKAAESPCESVYCTLLVRTLADENGSRIYADDDVSALALANAKLLYELFEKAIKINQLGAEAVDEAKKG